MGSGAARRKHDLEELDLNLNPMMDLFSVLIPALLMLSAAVEIAVVNVSAPAIGPSSNDDPNKPIEPPLNFTVTITEDGYRISAAGAQIAGDANDPSKPSLGLVEKTVLCSKYRGTVPPPRSKNKERPICEEKGPMLAKGTFMMYNTEDLNKIAVQLKNEHPNEKMVVVASVPTIDFEPMVDVMDAVRDIKEANGEVRQLFPEVVISPAAF